MGGLRTAFEWSDFRTGALIARAIVALAVGALAVGGLSCGGVDDGDQPSAPAMSDPSAQPGASGDDGADAITLEARKCGSGKHQCGGKCVSNQSVNSCGTSCSPCAVVSNSRASCDGKKCSIRCNAGFKFCRGSCIPNSSGC